MSDKRAAPDPNELSEDELREQQAEELPDREAMTVLDSPFVKAPPLPYEPPLPIDENPI